MTDAICLWFLFSLFRILRRRARCFDRQANHINQPNHRPEKARPEITLIALLDRQLLGQRAQQHARQNERQQCQQRRERRIARIERIS